VVDMCWSGCSRAEKKAKAGWSPRKEGEEKTLFLGRKGGLRGRSIETVYLGTRKKKKLGRRGVQFKVEKVVR